jgi:hypothetical protein
MNLINEEEIERYTSTDWVAVLMAVIIGLALTLVLADLIFGAENVTEWIANLFA